MFSQLLPNFSWERFVFSKVLNGKQGKIHGLLFIQSQIHSIKNQIKNDLHYLMYYRYDLHCGMSGDWTGEASWFVPPLSLSQLCPQKTNSSKNYYPIWSTGFPKQKTNFLPLRQLFSSCITERVVFTLTLWRQVVAKVQTSKPTVKNCCLFEVCMTFCYHPAWSVKKRNC